MKGKLGTFELLVKVARIVKEANNIFSIIKELRQIVLSLYLH
jgi:hypothetical protein